MSRLFDAYLIVDWSASSVPKTGKDSIWIGVLQRGADGALSFRSSNPPTRQQAKAEIMQTAKDLLARGLRVFAGFDFAFGYPAGTAQALELDTAQAWRAMWEMLARQFPADAENKLARSRFEFAGELNARLNRGPHPFWGGPKSAASDHFALTKGDFSSGLSETRLCENWVKQAFKANPKTVWQLAYSGAVGSQSMLGIPVVRAIREAAPESRIWPFETGLADFSQNTPTDAKMILAEVYPSTVKVAQNPGEILDQAQVRTLCFALESRDSMGKLGSAFSPPTGLSTCEIHRIEAEEGWILSFLP